MTTTATPVATSSPLRKGKRTAGDGLPGPSLPRAAQALAFWTRSTPWINRMKAQHGDIFRIHIADEKPWVVLSTPEQIKQVFTGSPAVFHAGKANSVLLPFLGDSSVLLLDDAAHLRQRKLMLPAFHGERMLRYADVMREAAEHELATWPVGETIEVAPRMQDVTLEVIMRAVFGMREGAELDELRTLLVALMERTTQPATFLQLAVYGQARFRELGWVKRMLEPTDVALRELFAQRRAAGDLAERDDILSMLMLATDEDGKPMTDQELRDELITLLVAGHETTATTLSWAVERLVRNPDVLARLRADLDAGSEEYLAAVIHETLRMRPVLPVVLRDLQEEVEISGYRLAAGTRVACSISLMHTDPEIYPEPSRFCPERFLEQKPGTYTWIPFGGGIRRCLGASFALYELKQILPAIVQGFDLEAVDPRPERTGRRLITLVPARKAEVRVAARRGRVPAAQVTEPVAA